MALKRASFLKTTEPSVSSFQSLVCESWCQYLKRFTLPTFESLLTLEGVGELTIAYVWSFKMWKPSKENQCMQLYQLLGLQLSRLRCWIKTPYNQFTAFLTQRSTAALQFRLRKGGMSVWWTEKSTSSWFAESCKWTNLTAASMSDFFCNNF